MKILLIAILVLTFAPKAQASCGVFRDHPQAYAFCVQNELAVAKARGEQPGVQRHELPSGLPGMEQLDALKRQRLMNNPWFRKNRVRDQILNHGMGGCTPNFATGGCL